MINKTVYPHAFERRVYCAKQLDNALEKYRRAGNVRNIPTLATAATRQTLKLKEVANECDNFFAWVESSHLNKWHAFEAANII